MSDLSGGHCSECDPSYGCFSGRGPCCKSPEPREDGAEYDRRRALRIAWQFTLETQTCEEAVSDLCRQLTDARRERDGWRTTALEALERVTDLAKLGSRIENLRSALSEIADPEHQPIHPPKRIALEAIEADDLEAEGG